MRFADRLARDLRGADDPARPIGPAWLQVAVLDITALGGPTVIWLVVLAVMGFLLLQARYRTALVILIAAAGGEVVNQMVKQLFMRPRPSVVPHLDVVGSSSFPSGHAASSLALAICLTRLSGSKGWVGVGGWCFVLGTGFARVALGLHYLSDILGGWCMALCWAGLCAGPHRWLMRPGAAD